MEKYLLPVKSNCKEGIIRWHEAGYVPGYRKCDHCEREFLAEGNSQQPHLVVQNTSN